MWCVCVCVCVSHKFSELMRVRLCHGQLRFVKGVGPGGLWWVSLGAAEGALGRLICTHTRLKNKRRSQLDAGALPGSRDNITDVVPSITNFRQ